jgi:hypothetical protein
VQETTPIKREIAMNKIARRLFANDLVMFYHHNQPFLGYVISPNDFRVITFTPPCDDAVFIDCHDDGTNFIVAVCPEACLVVRRRRDKR